MTCLPKCMGQNATFISMMFLTTSFFFVEIIVGYATNSMALVADSFHMLSDIISLFVGYFAMRYSKKTSGDINSNTFGWARAEVLGALVNAVFLVALCFSILVEAMKRMVETEKLENTDLILIVGGIGLLINVIGMFLFHGHTGHGHSHGGHGHSHGGHGHSHGNDHHNKEPVLGNGETVKALENNGFQQNDEASIPTTNAIIIDSKRNEQYVIAIDFKEQSHPGDVKVDTKPKSKQSSESGQMNMRGVYLHILGDALGSVIVIVAALIFKYVDGKWTLYVDPGMSIIMVLIILKTSVPLLKESSRILLQNVPAHIELGELEKRLLGKFPQILEVHEFHVWQLTGSRIVASLHMKCNSSADYTNVSSSIKEFFHHEGIHSTTIQPEFVNANRESEKNCLLACQDEACAEKVCCKPTPTKNEKGRECSSDSSSNPSSSVVDCSVQLEAVVVDKTHDDKPTTATTIPKDDNTTVAN